MILFLPKWYPSRLDPQLGVFVQKHARAVSLYEKVVVLSVQGDTGLKKSYLYTESREGNLYEVIIYFKKKPDTKKLCINAWHYLKAVRKGLYMIKTKHGIPALIHTHVLLRPVLLAWWLGKKYGIPFILTEHWTGFIYGAYVGKPGYYRWICSRLVSRAAAVTAVSPALLEALKKNRLHNPKMVVIPNVVEVSMPDFSGRKANDKIRILTVADLVER
ncbi:MAG: glycosyltransferase, partial [Bacteroidetes bacterium]|nr:glycosyltransferase [Bacteroidota bacterium]